MVTYNDPGPIEFEAVIRTSEDVGSAGWVEFPFDLKTTYGKGNLIPIKATFDGRVDYRGSLAMMGGECAMLLIRTDKRKELGKDGGETIHVRVELDTEPRTVELAADAQSALDAAPAAAERWKTMSYSQQREFQEWIEGAKRPETRQRRISRMIEMVSEGVRLKG